MNLAERLVTSASRRPDAPALHAGDRVVTYGELAEGVAAVAGALRGLGLDPATQDAPGDRVALLLGNTPEFVEAFHALAHAGLVAVPINVASTAEEVGHVLEDSGARAVVVGEGCIDVLDELRGQLPAIEEVIVVGSAEPPAGMRSWEALLDGAQPLDLVEVADDVLVLLQYTSGTTGRPKGAMLTHGNLLANQEQMAQTRLRIEPDDVVLCVLPLFHIYALNLAMAFPLACGACVRLVERFDAEQVLADAAAHGVTIIVGVPSMYQALLEVPGAAAEDLEGVRYALSGAAPLPEETLERCRTELGLTVWEGYGLTETAPLLSTVAMDEEIRPGSVGRPVPGVEVRLVGERGQPVRQGDLGEVVVRGPNVFGGYWQQPEATAEVLDADGWFRTGDVAYADGGDLYLVDRKRDLVIVNGFNVYPREVEEVLVRHPQVAEAAVIGVPHPTTGEAVRAFVVLEPGAEVTEAELIEFSARSLARFKCPEAVDFLPELPHLPSGKVMRRRLREDRVG